MIGITKLMREMNVGEEITVNNLKRCDLFKLAKRIGIKITTVQYIGGFYVRRVSDSIESIQIEKATNIPQSTDNTLKNDVTTKETSTLEHDSDYESSELLHDLDYVNTKDYDYAE